MPRKTPRNYELIPGVPRYSRSAIYGKRGRYLKKDWKPVAAKPTEVAAPKVKDFCGGKRTIAGKTPKWYPTEDEQVRRQKLSKVVRKVALKSTIKPGSVLILLAGKYQGNRVVFLKQLDSGLLLVTGPFKLNGVPLRRINQAYVIATSTSVDVSGVDVSKFNDAYFARPKQQKAKAGEFFQKAEKQPNVLSEQRKQDQVAVDDALLKSVAKVQDLRQYLRARFSLQDGQFPHALKF